MDFSEKLRSLHSLKRESEVHELLMDLLPKMRYKHVSLTHQDGNQPEYGKDIVAATMDRIENRYEWTAFVVKRGRFSGSTGLVTAIREQVKECFDYEWKSLHHGSIGINKVKVVANGGIASGAKEKIQQKTQASWPNVSFWDEEVLIRFIDKYYSKYWNRFIVPTESLTFGWSPGDAETIPWIVQEDHIGHYESFSQDGASGTISVSINEQPFEEMGNPITLNVGDRLVVRRSYCNRQGHTKWTSPRSGR